ncbi:MAG: hypothetical protein JXQ96_10265 [Cyclobacteriaceae bacterium]
MKNLKVLLTVLVFLCATALYAQSDFTDATKDASKIKAKADWPAEGRKSKNGGGWSVNPNVLGKVPKRVALVTYYLEDPGTSKEKQSATSYSGFLWSTPVEKANEHVKGFYDQSIDALVQAYDKYGMELLTPDQYLDTDEKKEFYKNFYVVHGKLKQEKKKSKALTKAGLLDIARYRAAPDGYRAMTIANEKANYYGSIYNFLMDSNESAFFQNMGYDLCTGLGVDAVVAVTIVTRKMNMTKEDYAVNHASMYMFGPNPIQKSAEEDKGLKGVFYIRGQFYCGSRVNYTKPVYFQKSGKKGTPNGGPVYAGMENVMTALTDKIGTYFKDRLAK